MLADASTRRRYWLVAGILSAAAAVVVLFGVPRLIEGAYYGRSPLGLLDGVITGQDTHPLETYLQAWRRIATVLLAAVVLIWPVLFVTVRWIAPYLAPLGPQIGLAEATLGAAAVGVVGGAVEGVAVTVRHLIRQHPLDMYDPEILWTSPIGSGIALGLLGGLFWALTRPLRLAMFPIVLGLATAMVLLGLSRSLQLGLHPVAAAVLMAGVVAQVARWSGGSRAERVPRLVFRIGGGAMVLALTFAIALTGTRRARAWSENRALPAAGPGAQNVLLLILDTVRAQSLGLYGSTLPTSPRMDAFAEDGVVFDRAFTASPWTFPSHATMFTARYPSEHGARRNTPLDDRYPTLAEVLGAHGYETAGFVANTFWLQPSTGIARGFVHYDARRQNVGTLVGASWVGRQLLSRAFQVLSRQRPDFLQERKSADDVNRELLTWLDSRRSGRPFFAMLNYFDAHQPYMHHPEYRSRVGPGRVLRAYKAYFQAYSPEERAALVRGYEIAVSYLDDQIGHLLDQLRERQLLRNTLVIITSDHGDEFGERAPDLVGHGNTMNHPVLRVPLIMALPGQIPAGQRVSPPVGLRALPSTILSLLGIPNAAFPGPSLDVLWTDSTASSPVLAQLEAPPYTWFSQDLARATDVFPMGALISGDYQYVHFDTGDEELFNYVADPFNLKDLYGAPGSEAIQTSLRSQFQRLRTEAARDRRAASAPPSLPTTSEDH